MGDEEASGAEPPHSVRFWLRLRVALNGAPPAASDGGEDADSAGMWNKVLRFRNLVREYQQTPVRGAARAETRRTGDPS